MQRLIAVALIVASTNTFAAGAPSSGSGSAGPSNTDPAVEHWRGDANTPIGEVRQATLDLAALCRERATLSIDEFDAREKEIRGVFQRWGYAQPGECSPLTRLPRRD